MFIYDKKLQYPVKIDKPNPRLAAIIISQYGGPDGELGASMRYLSQRYSMPFDELKGLLTDIGTEGSLWHRVIIPAGIVVLKLKMPDLRNVMDADLKRTVLLHDDLLQKSLVEGFCDMPARND